MEGRVREISNASGLVAAIFFVAPFTQDLECAQTIDENDAAAVGEKACWLLYVSTTCRRHGCVKKRDQLAAEGEKMCGASPTLIKELP